MRVISLSLVARLAMIDSTHGRRRAFAYREGTADVRFCVALSAIIRFFFFVRER
jgi:hypothetical protein